MDLIEVLKSTRRDFVARGFSQKEGVDYDDIFSLVPDISPFDLS